MTVTTARWIARLGLTVGGLEVMGLLALEFAPSVSRASRLLSLVVLGGWVAANTVFWIVIMTKYRARQANTASASMPKNTTRWVVSFAVSTILSLALALA